MPDSKTEQWRKFDPGGAYEALEATALDLILEERRQLRRASGSMRARRRRLVLGLRRYSRRVLSRQSESRSNFVRALEVICSSGELPSPGSRPTQHWMGTTATMLSVDAGLEVPIAHALVSWIGEFHSSAAGQVPSSASEFVPCRRDRHLRRRRVRPPHRCRNKNVRRQEPPGVPPTWNERLLVPGQATIALCVPDDFAR